MSIMKCYICGHKQEITLGYQKCDKCGCNDESLTTMKNWITRQDDLNNLLYYHCKEWNISFEELVNELKKIK